MTTESIPESELQRWFEHTAKRREICSAIRNVDQLTPRIEELSLGRRDLTRATYEGLLRARHLCNVLTETEMLVADNSIAPPGCRQMRPDLVLFTDSAHYVLVELKTRKAAERQGVQELMGYSAGIKIQAPYVNEFLYVVVAQAWDDSLSFSVRSLILDGKHVLPLRWLQTSRGTFELDIMFELFEFDLVKPYDPAYAMSPCTLAVSLPSDRRRGGAGVDRYFMRLAHRAATECQRLHQSGFVLIWKNPIGYDRDILSVTLVTVNQHWVMSEHLPENYIPQAEGYAVGFLGVIDKQAQAQYSAIAGNAAPADMWTLSTASEAAGRYYPQSSLSYDVLQGQRDDVVEASLSSRAFRTIGGFDVSSPQNLSIFMRALPAGAEFETILPFRAFGELADFSRAGGGGTPTNIPGLTRLLDGFQEHKAARWPRPR